MAGAPTKKELSEKRMKEIETTLRSKIPSILQHGLVALEKLVQNEDTAPAVVVRIVEYATKELKDLNEEDSAKLEGDSDLPEIVKEKPTLSLLSSK